MARTGGRSLWLAVPIGLLCAVVVAGLVWFAAPMAPVLVQFVGDSLRFGTAQNADGDPTTAPAHIVVAEDFSGIDCRALYDDDLWSEMIWSPDVLLSQTTEAPVTAAEGLRDVLSPDVAVTCGWRSDLGAVTTTLATVAPDAVTVADAALRGQGFSCTNADGVLTCTRTAGDDIEEHVVREGVWLSSVETRWHPEAYGARVAAHVWG